MEIPPDSLWMSIRCRAELDPDTQDAVEHGIHIDDYAKTITELAAKLTSVYGDADPAVVAVMSHKLRSFALDLQYLNANVLRELAKEYFDNDGLSNICVLVANYALSGNDWSADGEMRVVEGAEVPQVFRINQSPN